jgi:hypothetical protein
MSNADAGPEQPGDPAARPATRATAASRPAERTPLRAILLSGLERFAIPGAAVPDIYWRTVT